jgi:hypothetical protein
MVEQKIAMDYRDRAECRVQLIPYFYDSGGQTQLTLLCRESVDLFLRCCLISKGIYILHGEPQDLFVTYRQRFPELSDEDIALVQHVHNNLVKNDNIIISQAINYVCQIRSIVDKCLTAIGGQSDAVPV